MTDVERMRIDMIQRQINPPTFGEPSVILCPPLGSVDAYMQYIREHKADYAAFFGNQP